jgi:hypothetical protein
LNVATVTDSPFEVVQSNFVMFSPDNVDPAQIPPHITAYYDSAFAMYMRFRHYAGCRDIPPNDWPIVCLLAEQQRQIDELKGMLDRGQVANSAGQAAGEPATLGAVAPRRGPGRPRQQEVMADGG